MSAFFTILPRSGQSTSGQMQLPIIPVLILIDVFGLHEAVAKAPLIVFYGLAISAVAIALYAACRLFVHE